MDISLPVLNGIEAIRQIKSEMPTVNVLVLSMYATPQFVTEALGAGARGYLLKDAAGSELITAVRAVADNEVYLSPAIAGVIAKDYHRRSVTSPQGIDSLLTPRERRVVQYIAEGKNTKEIAFILNVSVKTVEAHRSQLMRKLNFVSIAELVKYAIREGLTPLT
jgi:DNA-binding NarL/FixJ family response regulator